MFPYIFLSVRLFICLIFCFSLSLFANLYMPKDILSGLEKTRVFKKKSPVEIFDF